MQEHYTPQEAASRLNVCVTTVYRMVKRGELVGIKEKGRLKIPASEVEKCPPMVDKSLPLSPFIASPADPGDIIKGEMSAIANIQPASVQVKVRYSLKFLKWLLQMNRMMNRALEAMIVFLESDGKAP